MGLELVKNEDVSDKWVKTQILILGLRYIGSEGSMIKIAFEVTWLRFELGLAWFDFGLSWLARYYANFSLTDCTHTWLNWLRLWLDLTLLDLTWFDFTWLRLDFVLMMPFESDFTWLQLDSDVTWLQFYLFCLPIYSDLTVCLGKSSQSALRILVAIWFCTVSLDTDPWYYMNNENKKKYWNEMK